MGTPFKMRGSPFQRNFGIGSPLHQEGDRPAPIGTTKKIETSKSLARGLTIGMVDGSTMGTNLPKALGTVNTDTDTDTEKARELTSHLTTKQKRINPTKKDDADDNRKKVLLKRKGNGSGNSITNIKNKIVTKRKNERINERIKK